MHTAGSIIDALKRGLIPENIAHDSVSVLTTKLRLLNMNESSAFRSQGLQFHCHRKVVASTEKVPRALTLTL